MGLEWVFFSFVVSVIAKASEMRKRLRSREVRGDLNSGGHRVYVGREPGQGLVLAGGATLGVGRWGVVNR